MSVRPHHNHVDVVLFRVADNLYERNSVNPATLDLQTCGIFRKNPFLKPLLCILLELLTRGQRIAFKHW